MGSVAEAVREFDEAVQVPWRPPLAGADHPADRSTGLHVFAGPRSRRPRAARVARLTVPPPPPQPGGRPEELPRPPGGSTAAGHGCARCRGEVRTARPVRLTRRARRLLAVVAAAAPILLAVWVGSVVDGGEEDLLTVSETSVVVRPGDTLWSIAGSVAGNQDVRAVVDGIVEVNGLRGVTIHPGQVLRLP